MRITWLGHSSVCITAGSQVIYIDPYAGDDSWYRPATLVLISSFHFDHCSLEKIKRVSMDKTHVLGTVGASKELFPFSVLRPGESRLFDDVEIVGMSVVKKGKVDLRHHEHKEGSELGFVIIAENKKVYFMGDSDFYPSLTDLHPDVLLVPVGGTFIAKAKDAAGTVRLIDPKLAIPIHFGSITGSRDDAELLRELVGVPVRILDAGEFVEI